MVDIRAMPDTASFWAMDIEDYVDALARIGADPSLPAHVLVSKLRELGLRGGDARLREAVRQFREPVTNREGWMSRAEAADQLGVSVQRIDQLRREGRLDWESTDRATGSHQGVLIRTASVKCYQLQRAGLAPEPCVD